MFQKHHLDKYMITTYPQLRRVSGGGSVSCVRVVLESVQSGAEAASTTATTTQLSIEYSLLHYNICRTEQICLFKYFDNN